MSKPEAESSEAPQAAAPPATEIQRLTARVSERELLRLVQSEVMALPDMQLCASGMAGRFPKCESINEYEWNLRHGVDMINDQDELRFPCALWGLPPRAGRLKQLDRFDSTFFGYTLEEANFIDYQLRILYEVVYESILDAGYSPAELRGQNIGVYFGLHCNEFENEMADQPNYKQTSGYYSQFAVKVAQYFDLRGITLTFDAACASSFVGLHTALRALDDQLIDKAIVCSSNIPIHPTGSFIFYQMQMLSPTGYSRFLDSRADGYVKSEACVSILLEPSAVARRQYLTFMSTMTSVDGYKPEGITFPSDRSQEELIRETKRAARLSTNHVEYLEAHGTGTPAGDPQEARAISNVYCTGMLTDERRQQQQVAAGEDQEEDNRIIGPLLVGSVKTNMGHSEAASGLCALAKAALMLENEIIYKSLHYDQPNTNIEPLMQGKLKFTDRNQPLRGKVIPLSCYGFGGSNVHIITRASARPAIPKSALELRQELDSIYQHEVVPATGTEARSKPRLVVMFGRTKEAVDSFFDQLLNLNQNYHMENCLSNDFLCLIDSLSANKIDRLMDQRGFLLVDLLSGRELARSIRGCRLNRSRGKEQDLGRPAHIQDHVPQSVCLLAPGLGSHWPRMAAGLSKMSSFWDTIERLDRILAGRGIQLIKLLTEAEGTPETLAETFVLIVAYQLAMVNVFKFKLDVKNLDHAMGQSLGEIACAYSAALLSEQQSIELAYELGQVLDQNKDLVCGKMVALDLNKEEAGKLLHNSVGRLESLRISCANGPESVTISGRTHEVDQFLDSIAHMNLVTSTVCDSVALHNEFLMNPTIENELRVAIGRVIHAPGQKMKLNWIRSSQRTASDLVSYFAAMLCHRVHFLEAADKLPRGCILIEIGASNQLEAQISQINSQDAELHDAELPQRFRHVATMHRHCPTNEQLSRLLRSIGELYQCGATFDLLRFYNNHNSGVFPVRRGTPSLSSLIRWQHDVEMFVPRYPQNFSKSSAKCEMPVDIVEDRNKFIADHTIEGRILYPATGYLYLIWRVFSFTKRKIYDACFQNVEHELMPIEFQDVRLQRATILGNRSAQIYIHYEEATGKFEIKEGGSVVALGYARSPTENPTGLLYDGVRDKIRAENLELEMDKQDVYKQFRVCGYDYGPKFQNIESCSLDGRYCRVNYNGHFIALTDSVLQSIFLAVSQYAPSGGLFLPTKFDYVRFQPEIILRKLYDCKMIFDVSEGALDTKAKREIMSKMMERNKKELEGKLDDDERELEDENSDGQLEDGEPEKAAANEEPEQKCIFETFCDPITGIIITDGIEMRGIRATPAPRRTDNISDVLLESYQFVHDSELPVEDEKLTRFKQLVGKYTDVCDWMSLDLLARLFDCSREQFERDFLPDAGILGESYGKMNEKEVDTYLRRNMECTMSLCDEAPKSFAKLHEDNMATTHEQNQPAAYDIKKNGARVLASIYDQLLAKVSSGTGNKLSDATTELIKEIIQKNRFRLMKDDLIQSSFQCERFLRPLMEGVIENCCSKKLKLKLIEINGDDALVRNSLCHLVQQIEPQLQLDYSLAHPDISRINSLISNDNNGQVKTFTLKSTKSTALIELFQSDQYNQLRGFDLILYKDISCYSLPKQLIEQNGLTSLTETLKQALAPGGYLMMLIRRELTLAERILLLLSEPELVGLSRSDLESMQQDIFFYHKQQANGKLRDHNSPQMTSISKTFKRIERINAILRKRYDLMLAEAHKSNLLLVSQKADQNGSLMLLLRRRTHIDPSSAAPNALMDTEIVPTRRVLRVRHDNLDWFDELKSIFVAPKRPEGDDEPSEEREPSEEQLVDVWLCAVETKQNCASGLIGMMRSLRKELGPSARLRCYYDTFTFKSCNEPVKVSDIQACDKFKLALERDQLWNCVDSNGLFGAYRHFTINDCLSPELSLCTKWPAESRPESLDGDRVEAAYVNNLTRGDLSSFAWHEAPFKHLAASERQQLVQVAYSALNFRDIMLASGRLPLDAIPIGLALADCLLGLEFSGIDADGRRVMGMVYGRGLATQVVCPRDTSIKMQIPDWMSLEEAATIPVAYATAIMALVYRGKMRRGESLLVHAGTGAVGQAAINLAKHFGLQIYVTCGSEPKRRFLEKEFGISPDRIFNSRDCSFEREIMRATSGRGVDLILNSLADDKLQASLNCLADGGRFLEIGKYDLSVNTPMELHKLDTNKTFHGILLDKLFEVDQISASFKHQLTCVMETMRSGLSEGFIRPLNRRIFARDQVEVAFRFMATGKHIGKVLIEIDKDAQSKVPAARPSIALKCVRRFQLSPLKSYIVSGGLGGFGLELIKWLVTCGARRIVITSRSGVRSGYQKATLSRLRSLKDVEFLIVTQPEADTLEPDGCRSLVELACEFASHELELRHRLGGIFHLAMVLKDNLLENMTREQFDLVCRTKINPCQYMDSATENLELDYFVAFSSITSGKGNSGQLNYAYANSCIERICERRRQRGLHGIAIQWGAIGDVGVAFEMFGGTNDIVIGGTKPQRIPSCLVTLNRVLCSEFAACLSVVPLNRGRGEVGEKGDLVGAIMHVLGIKDSSKVSPEATLGELGLDSLMAVEIRQYIEREYDMTLNIQEIRSLTIAKIREISENGKSAIAASARPQEAKKAATKQVASYASLESKSDGANKCKRSKSKQAADNRGEPETAKIKTNGAKPAAV